MYKLLMLIAISLLLVLAIEYKTINAKDYTLDQKVKELWGNTNGTTTIERCNKYAKDPRNCKITKSFIWGNESTFCKNAYNHNCFWINKKWFVLKSDSESIEDFNKRYNKYWYKNLKPKDFYPATAKSNTRTWYCKSEYQPNWKLLNYCPNGYSNATHIYNILITLK